MVEQIDTFIYKFRFIFMGVLLCGSLLLTTFLFSATQAKAAACATSSTDFSTGFSGEGYDANAVAAGMSSAANSIGQALDRTGHRISCNAEAIAGAFSGGMHTVDATIFAGFRSFGTAIAHGSMAVVHGIGHVLRATGMFIVGGTSSSIGFIANTFGSVTGIMSHTVLVGAMIRPSVHTPIPVIDDSSALPSYAAAAAALPVAKTASQPAPLPPASSAPQWPIHGAITTLFGVPEPPYEPIHTGLDISDGKRAGITPIHPFKPGIVIDVIHSSLGLGNHVIIDHGGGITSVYGHMYATNVQVGQQVDDNTVLGYEGSTGASTGPHVHFEIRINGTPVDPHRFIPGEPYQ